MRQLNIFMHIFAIFAILLMASQAPALGGALEKARGNLPADVTLLELECATGPGRSIPLWVYLPEAQKPTPVILFSHGLGGSRTGHGYLGRHWAANGYCVIMLQHPGSDEEIWMNEPDKERRQAAIHAAISPVNLTLRLDDVRGVLDSIQDWNTNPAHPLFKRLAPEHIGMSGHSFGALTTQIVSGETLKMGGNRYTDKRIKAALIMSPSYPAFPIKQPFGQVCIPWLIMTGTQDISIFSKQTVEERLRVFKELRPGHKYEMVIDGGYHMLFAGINRVGGAPLPPEKLLPIMRVSVKFWDAWLKNDKEAQKWLESDEPEQVLAPKDTWRFK